MDVERLIKLGSTQLSLQGVELQEWVDRKLKEEEERKKEEREAKKELVRIESEEKERERAAAREQAREAKEARQAEQEARKAEQEARQAEQEAAREARQSQQGVLQMQIELERLRQNNSNNDNSSQAGSGSTIVNVHAKSPRLPCFDERKDQIDSYLLRFERYASVNNWNRDDWATHLCALLSGKALEVYTRLNEQDALNYDVIKTELLRSYNLTEHGFANRFRNSRPEPGERMGQFKTRIAAYLDKWIEMAGRDKDDVNEVTDLILKEQLYNVCSKDLQTFLKERQPKTSDEVVCLTQNFVDAHGISNAFLRNNANFRMDKDVQKYHAQPIQMKSVQRDDKRLTCHRCFKPGHMAKDCRLKPHNNNNVSAILQNQRKTCVYCNKIGHLVEDCWKRKATMTGGTSQSVASIINTCQNHGHYLMECDCRMPLLSAVCEDGNHEIKGMPVAAGYLNGKRVSVLRDSGCSCVVIRRGLVPGGVESNKSKTNISLANGEQISASIVEAMLDCPYFKGNISAVEIESPLYDVILGNIGGARCPGITLQDETKVMAVETRSAKNKTIKPLSTPSASLVEYTVADLKTQQKEDVTLAHYLDLAKTGEVKRSGKSNKCWYGYENDIVVRYFQSDTVCHGDVLKQTVLPTNFRATVMKVAHEGIMAGHLAGKKTTERILNEFFWPNLWSDVRMYCLSCDQCQRSTPKGKTTRVPLQTVPLIDEPFKRVAIDIIGPIIPASTKGNRYILTVVDYCTRYPEAVAMKSVDTETIAENLVNVFSRTGIPEEILTDQAANLTSQLMTEVCRLLSLKQLSTTPYHPQCNGLVERFNGTLKSMLKKLAADRERDWDRLINVALFAYRECPQESLGFSPFELLYARPVRGPMTILRELWTKEQQDTEVKTTYQYVVDLREKMERIIQLSQENLATNSNRYKMYFDRKAKPRTLECGNKVLLLLPTKHNKLELKWQGPFEILKRIGQNNYRINIDGREKTYHANILKLYHERKEDNPPCGVLQCAIAAVVDDDDTCDGDTGNNMKGLHIEVPNFQQTECHRDVCVSDTLTRERNDELKLLLADFQDVLTDVPGRTDMYHYDLKVTSNIPIRKKPYPVPQAMKETLKTEVTAMLDAGVIEPSESPYCSPSVVVKKKDGSNRYCVDFRALNNVTIFDAEPMPTLDDLFQQIGPECNYLTKIDLSKGYWQIPLTENSKPKTAFATELGLMQFKVLPFGLQCAPAAFSRLMRKVLCGLENVKNYIDDILIHNSTWSDHLQTIKEVLKRLRQAKLTARPTKCVVAFPDVEFLGHRIGSGNIAPIQGKIEAIKLAKEPQNKKQMRSFIGLASFYRRYLCNFSAIISPLTDATRKGMPNRITWEDPQKKAFECIKKALTSEPVLKLPDFTKPFILSVDASDTGIGGILSQEYDGVKYPIIYLSRKLLPRETRYSVIERECLALVWAVQKLQTYLIGREFVIETDHAPLLHLNKAKSENGRLMRWALVLSQFRFTIRAVKGCNNHGPDFLSRI